MGTVGDVGSRWKERKEGGGGDDRGVFVYREKRKEDEDGLRVGDERKGGWREGGSSGGFSCWVKDALGV